MAASPRRSSRDTSTGREPLDQFATGEVFQVEQAADLDLCYQVGGADVGGDAASRVLRSAFQQADENIIHLRAQYKSHRRIVLLRAGEPVAVAVAVAHPGPLNVLEVPMLGVGKGLRKQGHGSLLVAIAMQLAAQLGLEYLVISATDEAGQFWLRQGLHNYRDHKMSDACSAATRRLLASGRFQQSGESTVMSRPIATGDDGAMREALRRIRRAALPAEEELDAKEVARRAGYEDLTLGKQGSFLFGADGVTRQYVELSPTNELPVSKQRPLPKGFWRETPYSDLRAFWTPDDRGYGVRCRSHIEEHQVVVEVIGRWLSDEEFQNIEPPKRTYIVSFEDEVLARKRATGDPLRYIDCREYGNMMRLLNDCHEAPNCEIMIWPKPDPARGIEPSRMFLVAKTDIPAGVELTWCYGNHYPRPWLGEESDARDASVGDGPPTPRPPDMAPRNGEQYDPTRWPFPVTVPPEDLGWELGEDGTIISRPLHKAAACSKAIPSEAVACKAAPSKATPSKVAPCKSSQPASCEKSPFCVRPFRHRGLCKLNVPSPHPSGGDGGAEDTARGNDVEEVLEGPTVEEEVMDGPSVEDAKEEGAEEPQEQEQASYYVEKKQRRRPRKPPERLGPTTDPRVRIIHNGSWQPLSTFRKKSRSQEEPRQGESGGQGQERSQEETDKGECASGVAWQPDSDSDDGETTEPVVREAGGYQLHLSAMAATGYKCVYRDSRGYKANVRSGGQPIYLGHFDSAVEAAVCVAGFLQYEPPGAEDEQEQDEPKQHEEHGGEQRDGEDEEQQEEQEQRDDEGEEEEGEREMEDEEQQHHQQRHQDEGVGEDEELRLVLSDSSATGFKGVVYNEGSCRYEARFQSRRVGSYATAIEAARAYAKAHAEAARRQKQQRSSAQADVATSAAEEAEAAAESELATFEPGMTTSTDGDDFEASSMRRTDEAAQAAEAAEVETLVAARKADLRSFLLERVDMEQAERFVDSIIAHIHVRVIWRKGSPQVTYTATSGAWFAATGAKFATFADVGRVCGIGSVPVAQRHPGRANKKSTELSKLQPRQLPASAVAPLEVGTRVKARWQGGSKWYSGCISNVRPPPEGAGAAEARYDVDYDDGDRDFELKRHLIKPVAATHDVLPQLASHPLQPPVVQPPASALISEKDGVRLHMNPSSASGYKGVSGGGNKYYAQVWEHGKTTTIGRADNPVDAALMYARYVNSSPQEKRHAAPQPTMAAEAAPAKRPAKDLVTEKDGVRLHLNPAAATGYKGVSHETRGRPGFRVQVYENGGPKQIGQSDNVIDAAVTFARYVGPPQPPLDDSGANEEHGEPPPPPDDEGAEQSRKRKAPPDVASSSSALRAHVSKALQAAVGSSHDGADHEDVQSASAAASSSATADEPAFAVGDKVILQKAGKYYQAIGHVVGMKHGFYQVQIDSNCEEVRVHGHNLQAAAPSCSSTTASSSAAMAAPPAKPSGAPAQPKGRKRKHGAGGPAFASDGAVEALTAGMTEEEQLQALEEEEIQAAIRASMAESQVTGEEDNGRGVGGRDDGDGIGGQDDGTGVGGS